MFRKLLTASTPAIKRFGFKKLSPAFIMTACLTSTLNKPSSSLVYKQYTNFSSQDTVNADSNTASQIQSIVEVKTVEEFQTLMKEIQVPLVLDCYAAWCAPCRKLTPMLEEKARAAQGRWVLAKFDIDQIPQLASALKLRSVPTVVLIHGGNAIDSFEGLPTDEVSQTFFDTVEKLCGLEYSEDEHQKLYQEGVLNIQNQCYSEAIKILKQLQEQERWIERHGAETLASLALAYIKSRDQAATKQCLEDLQSKYEGDLETPEVKATIAQVLEEFQQKDTESSAFDEMKEKLNQDPANNTLRIEIAQYAIEKGLFEEAIEILLDVLKIDRNFNDRVANKLLLEIFNKLGSTNPLVVQGRKKMQKILY